MPRFPRRSCTQRDRRGSRVAGRPASIWLNHFPAQRFQRCRLAASHSLRSSRMCRCASLARRAPVIPSRGCARGSATEDVVVLARRGEGNQARNALGQCAVSARVPACGRCALARRTARRCGPRSNPYRISPMRSRTQAVNQEGEPPTRKCPIRMQQKSHLRVRKRYADFAGCRGCNRQSLSLPSLKRMPPIWRDQTQIREENHIDVIFLSAADIRLHISAGRGHPSARLKIRPVWVRVPVGAP